MYDQIMDDDFQCNDCDYVAKLRDMKSRIWHKTWWIPGKLYNCRKCGSPNIANITVADLDISEEDRIELEKRMEDLQCPKRYVIVSQILSWRLYYNITDSTFCENIDTATKFKRRHHAELISNELGDDHYKVEEIE
jgi:hypothetical protein